MNPMDTPTSPTKEFFPNNTFDKSSMMSKYSFMSANTVFLQYNSNQLYFKALA